ncbi:MAG: VCBS domain-containing protein, partial [Sphingomicrobium sp.]
DGTLTSVTINITGTNDAATLSADVADLTEGNLAADISTSGTLTISDVDSPETFVPQAATAGTYGTFAIDADGNWTYTASSAHNEFVDGTLYTDTFSVASADGTLTSVTINITGTNDAAVISGAASGSVIEAGSANGGGTPSATGLLTDSDVDNPANTFTASSGSATYGTYTMSAGGTWVYTLDNANPTVNALNVGGTLTDTFTVTTVDGTSQLVTVTINGANDAAVISGTASGSVIEAGSSNAGGTPSVSGLLTDTDVDNPANTFTAVAAPAASANGYGTYTMTAGGTWTYTVNNANPTVNALNVGGTLTDTFTVTTVDGTPQLVTVTINGANDAAILSADVRNLTEANTPAAISTSGTLTISDVDSPATFVAQAGTIGSYGTFAINAAGAWTYNASSAHNEFVAGTTYTDTFTVTSADGTTTSVTVNIAGTNDGPVIDLNGGATGTDVTLAYTAGAAATAIAPAGTITDVDSTNFGGGTLTVAFTAGGAVSDQLTIQNQGVGAGQIGISGSNVTFGGVVIGTFAGGMSGSNLVITFNTNATQAAAQALEEHILYSNATSGTTSKTLSYTLVDGDGTANGGADTGTANATINVTAAIDTTPPTVVSEVITSATGIQNNRLNAGDVVTATVTMSEAVIVTGTPRLQLNIGGTLVQANYASGSGTNTLLFTYTILATQTDTNGISINANALTLNGGTIRDASNNSAVLTAGAVLDNANFVVDNTAPTVAVTGTSLGNSTGSTATVTFQFSETVTGFTVADVSVTNGSISNFTQVDGDTYTATVTRTSNGSVKVSVVVNSYTDLAGNLGGGDTSNPLPAGVAGSPINLALDVHADVGTLVNVTIGNMPAGWTLNGGTQNPDGSWTIQSTDITSLTVTTPAGYAGAEVLNVSVTWTNADGTTGSMVVSDNVEVFAPGNPIFAWSGDDTLTGSSGADTFVFSQPIGADVVHNFDTAADTIDLIGYGFANFAALQAAVADDASGNAVITLADGQTITLVGVSAATLTAANFQFDVTPTMSNAGTITIGDGALLPLSGTIDNSGTISLNAAAATTVLELIQNGITLQGGGHLTLSDSAYNVISGSLPSVTFNNVDNVISGAGQLGGGSLTLTNGGTIIADGFNALVIDTGANSVVNSGTIEATGAGGLEIVGSIVNSGLIWAAGGNIFIGGDVSGSGEVQISGTATVEIGGADSNNVVVGSGAAGFLVLDDAIDFTGKISGLNADDRIDLRDIAFGASTTMTYADDGAGGGLLTVTDGVNSIQLALVGSYQLGDFSLASDGQGGSLLTNTAGAGTDYGSGLVDLSQALSVAGGTDVIADGYLRVTTTGLVQIDSDGGGNNWVTLGHVDPAAGHYTVEYLSGGVVTTVDLTPVAPPIGIDLNGDGLVSFISTGAGATFDYGGGLVATAWVGPQDGILVRDANHDGQVTADEIVFATSGSDLQGLAAYDSNGDGQLSAADANFGDFAVWQDANSNGKVDAGELVSLTAQGIASISLSSDGVSYAAAGGDVSVVGTGSFTRTDGSTGVLADAVFKTGAIATEQQRAVEAANSNTVLLGAIAAAGLAAAPAAAETHFVDHGVPTNLDPGAAQNSVANPVAAHGETSLSARIVDMLQTAADAQEAARFASHGESKEPAPASDQHQLTGSDDAAHSGPAQLLAATEAPAQPEQSPMTAAGVMMPSVQQAQALDLSNAPGSDAHQSNEVVSKVLADALHGGGDGHDLDALLNALSGHDGSAANPALDALSSHASAAAAAWGAADFGGFGGQALAFHEAIMVVHPDAVQAT